MLLLNNSVCSARAVFFFFIELPKGKYLSTLVKDAVLFYSFKSDNR